MLVFILCGVIFLVLTIFLLILEQVGISKFASFVYKKKKLNAKDFEFKNLEEKSGLQH